MNEINSPNSIYVIVVNYKLKDDTIACLQSLLVSGCPISKIIVVDNASHDGSIETFKEKFGPELKIIEAEDNRGYPHALNIGIPVALSMGADFVLLMNNDVIVDKNYYIELQLASKNNPKYKLFSPMILYFGAPNKIWFMGAKAIPGTMIGVRSFRGRVDSGKFPLLMDIDFVHGCTMMVHKDVFEQIGQFDDEQLIYGDDADFSWRAKLAGFKMAAVPAAKMWHKISETMGRQKPKTVYLRTRNTILFYKRYGNNFQLIIMFIFTFFRSIIHILKYAFSRQFDLIPPMLNAWIDGWGGKRPVRYE
jgi:GT2 family glycosyltransferase